MKITDTAEELLKNISCLVGQFSMRKKNQELLIIWNQ